jgi:hypothetical protein
VIEIVILTCVAFAMAVYSYERDVHRIGLEVIKWREAYWKSLKYQAQLIVMNSEELASLRSALGRSQELIEDLNNEVDESVESRVLPESVGGGGQC